MYHLELRQFPHNTCRFNLDADQLQAIVSPWVRERPVEVGERRWSPLQAKLTIVEGPALEMGELSMGRGWTTAQRQGTDVTERVLEAARAGVSSDAGQGTAVPETRLRPERVAGPEAQAADDPLALGVALASLLGPQAPLLLEHWRAVAARDPELPPSESLAEAERELRDSTADRS